MSKESWLNRVKRELDTEAFLSGLNSIITVAAERGVETGFQVWYLPKIDDFEYPATFRIGDSDSINAKQLVSATNKWMRGEASYTDAMRDIEAPYPITQDSEYRKERGVQLFSRYPGAARYISIDVHVHQPGISFPSPQDLITHHNFAAFNYHEHLDRKAKYETPKTLSLIVTRSEKDRYPHYILLYQEKSEEPMPLTIMDFVRLSHGFISLRETKLLRKVLASMGSKSILESDEERMINQIYDVTYAQYLPDKGKGFVF